MKSILPEPIQNLPKADISLKGINAFISQSKKHQIIFMEFSEDVLIPEHSHESQWEIVLEGSVDVWIDDKHHTFSKGDRFYIPSGVKHRANIKSGYASIAFFNEESRYKAKM